MSQAIQSDRLESRALAAGMAVPVLYFASVVAGAMAYPGFSFSRQFASELGSPGAPHPWILNSGIIGVGLAAIISALGFRRALLRRAALATPTRWFSAIVAMFGIAIVMAGIFPHPDWRHSGFGLSFPIIGGPAVLAAALWKREDCRVLRRYLLVTNVLMIVTIVAFVGATHSPVVGLCQLLYTVAAIPWIGVAAWVLRSSGGAAAAC